MDVSQFRSIFNSLITGNDLENAEKSFLDILDKNPQGTIESIVSTIINYSNDICLVRKLYILLGRVVTILNQNILAIGSESFHLQFQNFLIDSFLFQNSNQNLFEQLIEITKNCAKVYSSKGLWNGLFQELINRFEKTQNELNLAYIIKCIGSCFGNQSINFNEHQEVLKFISTIFNTGSDIIFSATVYLIFIISSCDKDAKEKLMTYSGDIIQKISEINNLEVLNELIKYLNNFSEENSDFFKGVGVDCFQVVKNAITLFNDDKLTVLSILFLTNLFTSKNLEIELVNQYNPFCLLLIQIFGQSDINHDLTFDSDSNICDIVKESLIKVTHSHRGNIEAYFFWYDIFDQSTDPYIIILFGYVFGELIGLFYSDEIDETMVKLLQNAFESNDIFVTFAGILSFKKICKAISEYQYTFCDDYFVPKLICFIQSTEYNENLIKFNEAAFWDLKVYCDNFKINLKLFLSVLNYVIKFLRNGTTKQKECVIDIFYSFMKNNSITNLLKLDNSQLIIGELFEFYNYTVNNASESNRDLFFNCLKTITIYKNIFSNVNFETIVMHLNEFICKNYDEMTYKERKISIKFLLEAASFGTNFFEGPFFEIISLLINIISQELVIEEHSINESKADFEADEIIPSLDKTVFLIVSSSQIDEISEALNTLNIFIKKCGNFLIQFLEAIINCIIKCLSIPYPKVSIPVDAAECAVSVVSDILPYIQTQNFEIIDIFNESFKSIQIQKYELKRMIKILTYFVISVSKININNKNVPFTAASLSLKYYNEIIEEQKFNKERQYENFNILDDDVDDIDNDVSILFATLFKLHPDLMNTFFNEIFINQFTLSIGNNLSYIVWKCYIYYCKYSDESAAIYLYNNVTQIIETKKLMIYYETFLTCLASNKLPLEYLTNGINKFYSIQQEDSKFLSTCYYIYLPILIKIFNNFVVLNLNFQIIYDIILNMLPIGTLNYTNYKDFVNNECLLNLINKGSGFLENEENQFKLVSLFINCNKVKHVDSNILKFINYVISGQEKENLFCNYLLQKDPELNKLIHEFHKMKSNN